MALWRGVAAVRLGWRRGMCGGAEVCVFWDLNRCGLAEGEPEGEVEASRIAPNIVQALRSSGCSGPVSIHAYGNTRSFSHHRFLEALLATGVDLHHVPGGIEDLTNHLLLDLLLWMKETSPPAHMLLISGDKGFSSVMHKMHMRGYSVLLAHPEGAISPGLLSAASKIWSWDKMMKGTEIVARSCESGASLKNDHLPHFKSISNMSHNHSEPKFSYNQDVQPELQLNSDFFAHDSGKKPHNIPKKVLEEVIDIIRQRPSGFTVAAFRRQLTRSNVILDKDFYGHKDLLSFLLSVPRLKASLVWTSDKTRAYVFTEDPTGSTFVSDDRKGALSDRCDHNKYARSAEQEEEERDVRIRIEEVPGLQQLDKRSEKEEHNKRSIAEKATSADFSFDNSPATSQGILSGGRNVFLTAWRKACLKYISLTKAWQFLGFKAAKTKMALPETASVRKGIDNKQINTAASQTLEEGGKKETYAQLISSKKKVKGDGVKLLTRAMLDDLKACSGYATLDGVQEKRQRYLVKQCEVVASLEANGEQQPMSEEVLSSKSQEKQCMLQNEIDTTPPSLQMGEVAIIKEALKNTGLADKQCEDVILYFLDEGRRSLFTRATTVDDLLKFLMESNLESIAQLRHEDVMELAKILHYRIVLHPDNQAACSSQSKAMNCKSFSSAGKETISASTGTIPKPDASVFCELGSMEKHNGSKTVATVLSALRPANVHRDLKELLLNRGPIFLGSIKPEFKKMYGYELNHLALGHPSLASLIVTLQEFRISRNDKNHPMVSCAVPEGRSDGERVEEVDVVNLESFTLKS